MATCPHCGTENKDKAKFCSNCRKPLPMKLKRLGGTKPLPEKVPPWLTQLLDKYKEVPGPLIGLEPEISAELPPIKPEVMGEEEADLSAVLDQMAQEGPVQPAGDRLASSVEWGAYAETASEEPPAPSIDDMLAEMEYSPEDDFPAGAVQYEQPPLVDEEQTDLGVPDWLAEGLAAPSDRELKLEAESPAAAPPADVPDWLTESTIPTEEVDQITQPPEPSRTGEVPDWLTETPADFVPSVPAEEAETPEPGLGEQGVPEWLTETLEPPSTQEQELELPSEFPPATTQEEIEAADWLTDALQTVPEPGEEPVAPAEPESLPTDVPDWMDDTPLTSPESMGADEAEVEPEVPDWITEIVPPATAESAIEPPTTPATADADADVPDWAVPDWIAAAQMSEEEEAELRAVSPPESQEIPEWMVDEQTPAEPPEAETEAPDWLTAIDEPSAPTETPPAAPAVGTEAATPDWLTEPETPTSDDTETLGVGTLPADSDDWLVEFDTAPSSETTPSAAEIPVPPGTDWLSDTDLPPIGEAEETTAETPLPPGTGWLDEDDLPTFEKTQEAAAETSAPPDVDWLTDVDAIARVETTEAEAVPEPPTVPDIDILPPLPSTEAEQAEEEPKPRRKLKRLKPLKRLSPKVEQPSQPDWVAGLVPPGVSGEMAEETFPPDWATDLVPPAATGSTAAATPPMPDWIAGLVPPGLEIKTEASVEESPPKPLKKLIAEPEPSEILPDIPEVEEPGQAEELGAFSPAPIEPTPSLEPTEEVIPQSEDFDFEADQPGAPETQEPDEVDWIAQFAPSLPDAQELTEATVQPTIEVPAEEDNLIDQRLDWLTGPSEAETPAGEETSDWLAEIPEETVSEQGSLTEEELEIPEWLGETAAPPVSEEEPETPEWLAESAETLAVEETPEEGEEDVSDWGAAVGLAASATIGGAFATAVEEEADDVAEVLAADDAHASAVSTAEGETETPDWLSELGAASIEEGELETPAWLTESPTPPSVEEIATPLSDDELETPEWLLETTEISPADVAPTPPATEEELETPDWLSADLPPEQPEEEEAEAPEWLSEIPETPGEEDVSALLSAEETETPDWLVETPAAPVAEEVVTPPAEEEIETPDWLAELSAPLEDTESQPTAEAEVEVAAEPTEPAVSEAPSLEEEAEIPEWLSELRLATAAEEQELETPDWLAELPAAPDDQEDSEQQPAEDEEMPGWLTEIPTAPATGELSAPPVTEEEAELPPWLSELPEAPATEAESSEPVGQEEESELPDWLSDLEAAPADRRGSETPEWLAASPEIAAEEVAAQSAAELSPELPIEPVETASDEEEAEVPAWLAELEAAPAETEEDEIPDWLAEISEASDVSETPTLPIMVEDSEEPATPDWLVEPAEAPTAEDAATQPEIDEESPAGLVEPLAATAVGEETTSVIEVAAEEELPEWLSELPPVPTEGEVATLPADVETDFSEGLIEAREVPAEEELPEEEEGEGAEWAAAAGLAASAALGGAFIKSAGEEVTVDEEVVTTPEIGTTAPEPAVADDEEEEIPDWLAELREGSAAEETPEWLVEAPSEDIEETPTPPASEEGLEAPSEPPAEMAEPELADWLADLPDTSAVEEVLSEPDDTAVDTPDWLADTPVVEETDEMPDWPAELRGAPAEQDEAETPDWLVEMPEETLAAEAPAAPTESAAEIPDRLVETTEVPPAEEIPGSVVGEAEISEMPAEPVESVSQEEEVEVPDWLAELRTAPVEAEETPEWLVELPPEPTETEGPETPDWFTATVEAPIDEEVTAPPTDVESEVPEWLAASPELSEEPPEDEEEQDESGLAAATAAGLAASAAVGGAFIKSAADEEPKSADWLARLSEPLADQEALAQPIVEEAPDVTEEQAESPESATIEETSAPPVEEEAPEIEAEVPDWLSELGADSTSEEDLVIPEWLSGVSTATDVEATIVSPAREEVEEKEVTTEEVESEAPDRVADSAESSAPPEEIRTTQVVDSQDIGQAGTEPESPARLGEETAFPPIATAEGVQTEESQEETPDQAETDAPPGKPAEKKSPPGGVEPSAADDDDLKVAEATGVLAGLSSLLPAQEVATGSSVTALGPAAIDGRQDAVLKAAREFQAVATRTPQPATLPAPLTRRDQLVRGGTRAGLYLLFIVLLAIPLIPGLQKITSSGQTMAWTEPTGSLGEVLDKQRRELISNELGIVDFQQPGSVALVSFDYSPATQGEMQSLAEAVIGRLKGQGMRLIFMSLEPEGATVAQQTLAKILAERGEEYGVNMVNLGYVPGQVAAIRALARGQSFSTLRDYNTSAPFGETETAAWSDVENLGQVEMVVTLTDNPTTGRWWVEQMSTALEPDNGERSLLAATSAIAGPYLQPYRASDQLDGLVSGINGAAAIEASRKNFGPARQMLDSQSIAHLLIIILIAAGTMVGWMPLLENSSNS